ncbi:MAG: DUF3570 domain-containing protein [Myxococcales bacterium]
MKKLLLLSLALCGCATAVDKPTTARLQMFRYRDTSGLTVSSDGAEVQQPIGGRVVLHATGAVEEIVTPSAGASTEGVPAGDGGHNHLAALSRARPDVISSASSLVSTGAPSRKRRVEITTGISVLALRGESPVNVDVQTRVSQEADYRSFSGTVHVTKDVLQRNVTVAAFAGVGSDTVSPLVKPPGQDAIWPAHHQRVNGGLSVSQVLSPEMVFSAGASLNWQTGTLANPYRRALVKTTAFAESVPGERLRGTGFARLVWWLAPGTALHMRQGLYADDWGVRSLVPELTVARELGKSALFLVRGRYYWQSQASFYRPIYDSVSPLMSGDVRLGRIRETLVGAEARWNVFGESGAPGGVELKASYDRSWISYPDISTKVAANIFSLAVTGTF